MKRRAILLSLILTACAFPAEAQTTAFVFSGNGVRHTANPTMRIRIGERVTPQALRARFSRYHVHYAIGERCTACATVSGGDGSFEVYFARDARTVIGIRTSDERSRDSQDNAARGSLLQIVGTVSVRCHAGDETTCASPDVRGLAYIIVDDQTCPLNVEATKPTTIAACTRIDGFLVGTR